MKKINASEIVDGILAGDNFAIDANMNSIDWLDVEIQIEVMDGKDNACDNMLYGQLKRQAAYLVVEKHGEDIADCAGCEFVNDMNGGCDG